MLKIERREAGRNPRPGMSASRKRIMMPTRPRRIAGAALAVSLLAAVPARAASESVLYQFQNGRDGAYSFTGLTELDGTLYGGTWGGGNAHGTVFALTKDGKQKVLHAFDIGAGPYVGNLINVDGTFYGTTYYGGTGGCISDYADGCGTIFTVTPTGSYKTLFNFHGSSDGEGAVGLLKVGNEFFGTTALGGAANAGTIFKVSTTGHLKTLYTFKGGSDGANPFGTLINVGGTLYGTTEWGGSANDGTIFKVTKAGVKTLLHSFQGGDDGVNPESGLTNVSGTLYGTTFTGGTSGFGTVFSVTPAGVETVVHSFAYQGAGGAEPVAPLLNVHGVLYGTTQWGGTFGSGTLFRMTTAGDETVLHGFADAEHDGELPSAGLVYSGGTIYGTTQWGGTNNQGTVFQVSHVKK